MTAAEFAKVEEILRLNLSTEPEKAMQIMRDIRSAFNYRSEGSRPGYKGSLVVKPIAQEIPVTRWF